MIEVTGMGVNCFNRNEIPNENETILDDMGFTENSIQKINIYLRNKQECPFNRGNWIVDILFKDGEFVCIKLPKDMTKDAVLKFFKPIMQKENTKDANHN